MLNVVVLTSMVLNVVVKVLANILMIGTPNVLCKSIDLYKIFFNFM